jgi:pilus assembly protein CpaE
VRGLALQLRRVGFAANRDPGQASVELVAVLPALVVCVALAAQALAAGWALWSAGNAARAGARAEHVGSDGAAAARRSLPAPLRDGARVSAGDGVEVSVRVPALLPGITMPRIAASSTLAPDAGTG